MSNDNQEQQTSSRVTFNSNVIIHEELHYNDYTDEEVFATWYTEDDEEKIMNDIKETLELIRLGELDQDTEEFCQRGLESRISIAAKRKRNNMRQNSRLAVFNVQEMYQNNGQKIDVGMLSRVYSQHTQQSVRTAYVFGLKDQSESLGSSSSSSTTTMSTFKPMLFKQHHHRNATTMKPIDGPPRPIQMYSKAA